MKKSLLLKHLFALFLLSILHTSVTAQIKVVREPDVAREPEDAPPTKQWVLFTRPGTPPSAGQFVNGPAAPPMGCGSFQMTTATGAEKVQLFNFGYATKPLGSITSISYSTFRIIPSPSTPAAVASLNVLIDPDGPGGPATFSTLVFEPAYNVTQGPIVDGIWQTWVASGTGLWWSTKNINGQPAGASIANLRTWSQIVANNPGATILGGVGVNQGSGNGGLTSAVDNFTFGDTTYNFEQVENNVVNTNTGRTYCTIQAAINDPLTLNGHTIIVGAGTYIEDVNVSKDITLKGSGIGVTTISGPIGGNSATVQVTASGATVEGFTITREGNNTSDWNNGGLNSAGIAIQGLAISGVTIQNNELSGNRTGIDINNSGGHSILNNDISKNRTGLLFRNRTDDMTVTNNFITNNWTIGVLFLNAGGDPPQQALNSHFNYNNITGNWYGQVEDRQPTTTLSSANNSKDFTCNWWGTTDPTVTTTEGGEPGYAAQIPVAFGGTAVPPAGNQPEIKGSGSSNIIYIPYLTSGGDGPGIGFQPTAPCAGGLSKKECKEIVEQQKKDFEAQQRADKKAFDDQQKADKELFNSQTHTAQERKDFEEQQKDEKKAFDDQQKADKKAFDEHNKADMKACDQKPDKNEITQNGSLENMVGETSRFAISNYPNPFTGVTTLQYQLPMDGKVSLKVFDILGRPIATLVDETKNAGTHQVTFDGNKLSKGNYYYRIIVTTTGNKQLSKVGSMTVVK